MFKRIMERIISDPVLKEFASKFGNIPLLERFYWGAFLYSILLFSIRYDFFLFGLAIAFFILLGVAAFDKKEIPFTIVSLFFALLAYNVEQKSFLLEHKCYLGVDVVDKMSFTGDGKIHLVMSVHNDSNYLAKNIRPYFGFRAGDVLSRPVKTLMMNSMVVFPHTKMILTHDIESSKSLPEFINGIKDGKTDLFFDVILEYDGDVGKNFKTIENFECFGGLNNTCNTLNAQVL